MPHYVHNARSGARLHLYHLVSRVGETLYPKWVIGPVVGDELGYVYVAGWATAPHAIDHAWSVRYPTRGWRVRPQLCFRALEHASRPPLPDAPPPPPPPPALHGLSPAAANLLGSPEEQQAALRAWLLSISEAVLPHAGPLYARGHAARLDDAELRDIGVDSTIHRHAILDALSVGDGIGGEQHMRGATHHTHYGFGGGESMRGAMHVLEWEVRVKEWGRARLRWFGLEDEAHIVPDSDEEPGAAVRASFSTSIFGWRHRDTPLFTSKKRLTTV